jgi:hypothetical protein
MLTEKMIASDYLFPIQRFGSMGKIHSVFERSFNVQVNNQLININNYRSYLAAFGMYLPEEQFQQIMPYVEVGNLVKIRNRELMFYSTKGIKRLSLAEVTFVSLQVKEFSFTATEQAKLKAVLLKQNLIEKIGLPLEKQAIEIFAMMKQPTPVWQQIIPYLIGRGKGLTPSGDDLLVAYQAMLYAFDQPEAEKLATALKQPLSTTDVSKAYIATSIKGFVNSLIYQLLNDLKKNEHQIEKDVKAVMRIGHSSGIDLCFGMLLALEAIILE